MRRHHFDPAITAMISRYGQPPFQFAGAMPLPAQGLHYLPQTLLNALSIPLPMGERFIIRAMCDCMEQRPQSSTMKEDIRLFVAQESVHLRQHNEYNRQLCAQRGYGLAKLEFPIRFNLDEVERTGSLQHRLAITVCIEHLTAAVAEAILAHPAWLDQGSEPLRQLWQWHALEEIDHRSVAFDLYVAQGYDMAYVHQLMPEFGHKQLRFLEALLCAMVRMDGADPETARLWLREEVCGPQGLGTFFRERVAELYLPGFDPRTHDALKTLETLN
jgi:predicted metal-dependent hydrolase